MTCVELLLPDLPLFQIIWGNPPLIWHSPNVLDIFETPTGPPDPRSPKTPQQQKKKFQKPRKPRLSPKVDARSPKVDARSPKVDARSPKVNVKGIFEEFKVFEISCWGVTVTGVSKISNECRSLARLRGVDVHDPRGLEKASVRERGRIR